MTPSGHYYPRPTAPESRRVPVHLYDESGHEVTPFESSDTAMNARVDLPMRTRSPLLLVAAIVASSAAVVFGLGMLVTGRLNAPPLIRNTPPLEIDSAQPALAEMFRARATEGAQLAIHDLSLKQEAAKRQAAAAMAPSETDNERSRTTEFLESGAEPAFPPVVTPPAVTPPVIDLDAVPDLTPTVPGTSSPSGSMDSPTGSGTGSSTTDNPF